LDRSNILDIGNKNIVLYCIEIMLTIHRPNLHMFILKNISSRTSTPISIKLGANHPWVKGILNCTNKGPRCSSKGR
jgi:hypothetical protein